MYRRTGTPVPRSLPMQALLEGRTTATQQESRNMCKEAGKGRVTAVPIELANAEMHMIRLQKTSAEARMCPLYRVTRKDLYRVRKPAVCTVGRRATKRLEALRRTPAVPRDEASRSKPRRKGLPPK